ncbi:MAG TPA: BON domain-containing protein [Steroidobacteraceae bacterium]|jgi:hyperosmotically inducible periplasmic protein
MARSFLTTGTVMMTLAALAACAGTRTQQSTGEHIDDALITTKVKAALIDDPVTKARQIEVDTFRGTVQLNGFVDSADEKTAASRVTHSVNGVQNVRNNLVVGHTDRSAGEVVDDSVVTTKVKAALVAEPATKARDITVVTRDGIVQLSGFVDSATEKATAAEVAQGVSGVREVRNDLQIKAL